jgi:uncharacterized repeat protein (TIGR01451 family)
MMRTLAAAVGVGAGLVLAVAAGVAGGASASAAGRDVAPPVAPQLSITISDDRDAAVADDELSYTIVVENLGTTDALGLAVTQSVPDGMTFGAADNSGTLTSSTVNWNLDVKAAEKATLSTTMTVGETPADLLRLASVACALAVPTDQPIVCASDSDMLPAGAAAAAADTANPQTIDHTLGWVIGGSLAVVIVAGTTLLLVLRRRRVPRAEG